MHNDWFDRYYPLVLPGGLLAYDVANIDGHGSPAATSNTSPLPILRNGRGSGRCEAATWWWPGVVARLTGLASREALTKGMTAVVPAHRADRISREPRCCRGRLWLGRARGARCVRGRPIDVTQTAVPPQSLADYLWHWQHASPNRLFTSDSSGHRYTYAETAAHVGALSAELARRGVVAGDRVAIVAENSSRWIIAFLAAIASGAIAVPLATRLTTDELDLLLDDADPLVIVVDPASLPTVAPRWHDRVLQPSAPAAAIERTPLHGRRMAMLRRA